MSWSQGQAGHSNFPAINQSTYRGFVRVLPSFPPPVSPHQYQSQRAHTTTTGNAILPANYSGALSEYSFSSSPILNAANHQTRQENGTVPRLPPPPKSPRINNNQRTDRRATLNVNVQDPQNVENGSKQENPLQMPLLQSGFHDKRKLHLSAQDLRETESPSMKPTQTVMRPLPLSTSQHNRTSLNYSSFPRHEDYSNFQKPRQPSMSMASLILEQPGFESTPALSTAKQNKNEMSSLHDQLAQLKLELAAMKDPMKEHEEWLKSQSVQLKELEELQRKMQSSIESDKHISRNGLSSTMTNSLPLPQISQTSKSPPVPPPKSTKPDLMSPDKMLRPPITSAKPTQQKFNSLNFPKTGHIVASSIQETIRNMAKDEISGSDQFKHSKSTHTLSDVRVKRISQLFEASANNVETASPNEARKNNCFKNINESKNKISPALLQSMQALKKTNIPLFGLPTEPSPKSDNLQPTSGLKQENIKGFNKSKYIPAQPLTQPTKYLPPPQLHSEPSALPSVPPAYLKPSELTSVNPLRITSEYTPNTPLLASKPSSHFSSPSSMPIVPKPSSTLTIPPSPSKSTTPLSKPSLPSVSTLSTSPSRLHEPMFLLNSTSSSLKTIVVHSELEHTNNKANPANSLSPSDALSEPKYQKHRYENIVDEIEAQFPSQISVESAPPLPLKVDTFNQHRYSNELEYKNVQPPKESNALPPNSPKDYVFDEKKAHLNVTYPDNKLESSVIFSMQHNAQVSSTLQVVRPTAPPPPPPPALPKTVPPPPPLPQINTRPNNHGNFSFDFSDGPASPQPSANAASQVYSPSSPQNSHNQSTNSSSLSSLSSPPGTPLSPSGNASKADLMEQIRQFKQTGKSLKQASSAQNESTGTPKRVRKDSMHDALQTRFHAFCGNLSESSEDEDDYNNDEDYWDE